MLDIWKAALTGLVNGTTSPILLPLGDSTTFGVGSNDGVGTDLVTNSYPAKLRGLFNTAGYPAQSSSFVTFGSATYESRLANDPRVVTASGWVLNANGTLGGVFAQNSTTSNALTFTPGTAADTFRVWYVKTGSSGTLRLNIDGGTNTDTATTGSDALAGPITLTAALASNHVLNIIHQSGGSVFPVGVEALDSTVKNILVRTAGWPGARSTEYASTAFAWSAGNTGNFYGQHLALVMIGINDWNGLGGAVTPTQYKANMQVLITKLKLAGDVVIVTPVPTRNSTTPLTTQATYIAKMVELATDNSLPLIDIWSYFGSWETRNPQGWYTDNVHPSNLGYTMLTQYIYDGLWTIMGPLTGNTGGGDYQSGRPMTQRERERMAKTYQGIDQGRADRVAARLTGERAADREMSRIWKGSGR